MSFTYINQDRVAYVNPRQIQGPRGGYVQKWEARADAKQIGADLYRTKKDARQAVENYLEESAK